MSRLVKTTDALGNTTLMSYGLDSQLESIIDANGNTSFFQYDVMGRLIREINPRGFETSYVYDVLGNLTEVHKYNDSEELITVYEYNSKNQLIKETSPAGAVTLYTYDANGNITLVTDAEGYETISAYDVVNNLINVIRPDTSQIQYAYDALNRVTEATDGEGNITQYAYDSIGNIISKTDPRGNSTTYSYDALNQLTSVTNALGNTTSYTYRYDGKVETVTDAMNNLYINNYNAAGQLVKEILPNNYTTSYTYDLLGRVSSVTDAEGLVSEFTYDGLGNTLKQAYSNGTFETMAYDANSNLVKTTDAMGNVTQYAYDFDDRLISIIDALGYEKTTSYTKDGQVSAITDGNGNQTEYEYNLLGKATKTIDGLGNEVDYTYDPVGNLREIHQYKGITASTLSLMNDAPSYTTELDEVILKYEYNSNGQLTKEINPSGTTVSYTYDKNGNLISKQDEDGYLTNNTYDSVNNLTQVKYNSGKTVSYTYNPNNQITSMTDWLGTNTYDLDVLGRINTVTDYEGRVTGYTWNSRNQKLSMTYPDGSQVKYSYDIKGNLLKVIDGNGKETSYTYDALDRINSEVLPNGVKTTKTYDALSRIAGETSTKKDGTVIYSNAYSLDSEGNILSETKKIYENGNKLSTTTTNYLYDSNNQLIQTNNSEGILEKYFYDTLGNRIHKERTVPGNGNNKNKNKSSTEITKYTYNNENQMITLQGANEEVAGHYTNGELVTFSYDKRGNVRSITTDYGTIGQYYYDDTNKMTYSINKMGIKSAYTYDGAGRRVKETLEHSNINVPEKANLHVQTPMEELLDINQNIALDVKKEINYVIDSTSIDNRVIMAYGMQTKTQRYTYGNGIIGLDSWNDKATDWEDINQNKHDEQLYYVKDFRGSVLALTDYKCKITTTYDYDAFGTPIEKNHVNDQGIRSNIYHYAGYIYDYTTSIYFVNARYYMPETARFMAEDVFKGDGLNRYVYVRNNPLIYVDPMGYACSEVNSAITHLQALLKLIEAYPKNSFWSFNWLIKSKEQNKLIAQANTIKDTIKKTDEYKNDEIFKLLVDKTFDKKSYKDIGKAEEVYKLIDYLVNHENKLTAYIFYARADSQNGGFDERAKADAKRWEKEMGTDVVLVAITSEKQFVEEWGKMGNNGETVQYVGLYFHSNANNLFINTDNDEYVTVFDSGRARGNSGPEATAISSLGNNNVKINNLYLYSCNSGHVSHKENNLAATFTNNYNITNVYAWDGNMKWSKDGKHTRLAFSQDYFEGHLNESEKRDPKGMVRYYKDSTGKVQYETVKPVGSERQNIFWKFDLWETKYK